MRNKFMQSKTAVDRLLRKAAVLCTFVGLVATSACSSDSSDVDNQETDGRAISFRVGGDNTRGAIVTTADLKKIGVFGYSHAGNFNDDVANRKPDYFLNKAVIYTNTAWGYDGVVKYWPGNGQKVSFFAYAPYIDVENTFVIKPLVKNQAGAPTIEYNVPLDVKKQVDLLYNKQLDKNGGTVSFSMDHALTRIGFVAKLHADEIDRPFVVTIKEISITNVVGNGTFNLLTGDWNITRPSSDNEFSSYTLTTGPNGGLNTLLFNGKYNPSNIGEGEVDPAVYHSLTTSDGYLMLLPQALEDGAAGLSAAQVTITYEVRNLLSGATDTRTEVKDLAGYVTWDKGKGITYQIDIQLTTGVKLEVETGSFIDVDKWQNVGNEDNISIS